MFSAKNIIVFVVLAVLLLLFMFFPSGHAITNIPVKEGPIVAYGDSLVEGVGTTPGNTFVDVLSERIREPILNLGVSGDTTEDGVKRLEEVLDEKPRIVVLLLGGNDALKRVPAEDTFKNIRTIISELQSDGVAVLLVAPPGGISYAKTYEKEFENIAQEYGVAYVPNILKGLLGKKEYMADIIHPNDVGHAIMADKIEPALRALLEAEK